MTARTAESESGPERKRYFDLVDNGLSLRLAAIASASRGSKEELYTLIQA